MQPAAARSVVANRPAILCPQCGDRVPLDAGSGPKGEMTWTCRNGHTFGKRAPRPSVIAARPRPLSAVS